GNDSHIGLILSIELCVVGAGRAGKQVRILAAVIRCGKDTYQGVAIAAVFMVYEKTCHPRDLTVELGDFRMALQILHSHSHEPVKGKIKVFLFHVISRSLHADVVESAEHETIAFAAEG